MDWSELQPNWQEQLLHFILIALAGALGACLGWERETAEKPAGLRTHILVCATAAFLMLLGDSIINVFHFKEGTEALRADPIRIVQSIVVGISFLGAGTIIQGRHGNVEGLTTAASILLTAAIGMAVASQQILLAIMVTVAAFAVLRLIGMADYKRKHPDKVGPSPSEQSPPLGSDGLSDSPTKPGAN